MSRRRARRSAHRRRVLHGRWWRNRKAVHDLAATGRVTDMDGVLEVEMCGQRREIVGVVIHVMAAASLRGSPWPRRSWAMTR